MWSNANNCCMLTNENEVNTVPDPVTQPSLCCDLFIILVRSLFSVDLQSEQKNTGLVSKLRYLKNFQADVIYKITF